MTNTELIKQLILAYKKSDQDGFEKAARDYIEREKRKNHTLVVKELEKVLYSELQPTPNQRRFKSSFPIPRDTEKGFPLLEIQEHMIDPDRLLLSSDSKEQINQIIKEYRDADILATYNLKYKQKILLCGKPGTGKTFTAQIFSSMIGLPLVYIRFDAIISSYLGETASNLRKVFDFIEQGNWIVLFDEFDVIGKNRDDIYEHGEIKRVVNNFLQMLDNYSGESIIFAATNHQHMLDSAIWRRFDDIIHYDLPDLDTRTELLMMYTKSMKHSKNINFQEISKKTDGLSPADIKMIAHEAMKVSIINSRYQLTENDLSSSIKKFIKREDIKYNKL